MAARTRVLVLDHTAREGGAELALLRVVERLGAAYEIRALVFEYGAFVARLRSAGIHTAVCELDGAVNATSRDSLMKPAALLRSLARLSSFVPRLARAIRGSRAELVVANSLKSAVFTAVAAPLAGRRWVWHLHDRLAPDYLPRPVVAVMRALAVVGPRRIVVNSRATLETLPASARAKATIAYPGLTADAFEPAKPVTPPVVGIIGRISPTKGQREFLEAAAIIGRTRSDVRFRIVGAALFGEDDYAAEIARLPAELGIDDRVESTGWVSDPGAELRQLSVLVHASPVPEPFGQVVVEAMAAGVPVVATDAGGVPEIVLPDGPAGPALGELVPTADAEAIARAVEHVLADPDSAAAVAARARRYAQGRFTIEETVRVVRDTWTRSLPWN